MITDLVMLGMGGINLATEVRKYQSPTRIVLLAAGAEEVDFSIVYRTPIKPASPETPRMVMGKVDRRAA